MNFNPAVVVDEAEFAESIHEEAYPRPRGAHQTRQCLLADIGNRRLRFAFLPEVGQQKQDARQTLLAGIEKLIYQILLDPNVTGEYVG